MDVVTKEIKELEEKLLFLKRQRDGLFITIDKCLDPLVRLLEDSGEVQSQFQYDICVRTTYTDDNKEIYTVKLNVYLMDKLVELLKLKKMSMCDFDKIPRRLVYTKEEDAECALKYIVENKLPKKAKTLDEHLLYYLL